MIESKTCCRHDVLIHRHCVFCCNKKDCKECPQVEILERNSVSGDTEYVDMMVRVKKPVNYVIIKIQKDED